MWSNIFPSEANLIFVVHFHHKVPGGYWFLTVSSFLDGALGGTLKNLQTGNPILNVPS